MTDDRPSWIEFSAGFFSGIAAGVGTWFGTLIVASSAATFLHVSAPRSFGIIWTSLLIIAALLFLKFGPDATRPVFRAGLIASLGIMSLLIGVCWSVSL